MSLFDALVLAGSQDNADARKKGEQQISNFKSQAGFLTGLLEIYLGSADFEIRWLAIIQMKNNIEGLWRNAMVPEEKDHIRSRLIDAASSGDSRFEKQFALVVAKVAKLDFPKGWPSLFEDLTSRVQNAASENELRVPLLLLHHVLKVIHPVKIGPQRIHLNELSAPLLEVLVPTYTKLLHSGNLDVSYICLKAIGTLIYGGPDGLHRQTSTVDLSGILKELLPQFAQTHKHVHRIGKIFERTSDRKPVTFCMLFNEFDVLDIYRGLIIKGFPQDDKVIIQGANILVNLLDLVSRDVRTTHTHMLPLKLRFRDQADRNDLATSYDQTNAFFTADGVLLSIVEVILSRYFVLTENDIELWKEDPEDFVQEELLATHEFSVKVCFQLLYFKLLKTYSSLGDQVMVFIEQAVKSPGDILQFDAALQALQYGSFLFSEKMQISEVFESLIMLVTQNAQNENYNIIRRRMCLLVAEWLPIHSTSEIRTLVYRVVTELLFPSGPLNDLPVQLAALQALKCAVDDLDFETTEFMPFAEATFLKIYSLLNHEVKSLDIKRSILEVLCTLVEQLGRKMSEEHVSTTLDILPPLWSERSDNQLVKAVIIQTLMHLVDSAKEKSPICHKFAAEVLEVSVDPKSSLFTYLVEDALGLWQSLITNADKPYPILLNLFKPLLDLLTHSTENIGEQLTILVSYIQLEPSLLANPQESLRLLSLFAEYLPSAGVEPVILMLNVIEVMAKYLPLAQWHESLMLSGLVPILTSYGCSASGDLVIEIRMTRVFSILSWMAIQNPQAVVNTFSFSTVLDGWSRSIKVLVGDPHDRKLLTLGLTRCAEVSPDVLSSQAPLFIDLWTMVLDEVNEQNGDAEIYHAPLYPGETEDDLTPEQIRIRALSKNDPVHHIDMKGLVTEVTKPLGWQP